MKTYFISGHRNITDKEFNEHYVPLLDESIKAGGKYVVGDCVGVDNLAQIYLKEKGITDITVYHMFDEPRYGNGLKTKGGFKSDFERDFEMTKDSDVDIAWVRAKRSGTQQNLDRRKWMNERIKQKQPIKREDLIKREANLYI